MIPNEESFRRLFDYSVGIAGAPAAKKVRGLTKISFEFYTNPPKGFSDKPLLREREAIFLSIKEPKILAEPHYEEMKNEVNK